MFDQQADMVENADQAGGPDVDAPILVPILLPLLAFSSLDRPYAQEPGVSSSPGPPWPEGPLSPGATELTLPAYSSAGFLGAGVGGLGLRHKGEDSTQGSRALGGTPLIPLPSQGLPHGRRSARPCPLHLSSWSALRATRSVSLSPEMKMAALPDTSWYRQSDLPENTRFPNRAQIPMTM